ncbi:MAG: flagellin [Alphaproteobacteria bacterium ADurb.Bin438]|nr:MAG: flagellin [Alphaproteobacteria bacterium ADurb.Bin438]
MGIRTNGFVAPSQGNFNDLIDQIKAVDEALKVEIDANGKLKIIMTNGDDIIINDLSGTPSSVLGIQATGMDGTNVRKSYAEQYDTIVQQIDDLILNNDSSYKGTNLLNGQDLTVYFNEYRTSSLKIDSVVFDTLGLGIKDSTNEWKNNADIQKSLSQVDGAISMIEAQASEFGQNLSAIQNRQDFTENMTNILTTGADSLTLADMNEEAANMLSLKVRQELGTNALSLASQSQQSVLKLF